MNILFTVHEPMRPYTKDMWEWLGLHSTESRNAQRPLSEQAISMVLQRSSLLWNGGISEFRTFGL